VSVSIISWVCMPLLIRAFSGWLYPERRPGGVFATAGGIIALALLAAEIALMSWLFRR